MQENRRHVLHEHTFSMTLTLLLLRPMPPRRRRSTCGWHAAELKLARCTRRVLQQDSGNGAGRTAYSVELADIPDGFKMQGPSLSGASSFDQASARWEQAADESQPRLSALRLQALRGDCSAPPPAAYDVLAIRQWQPRDQRWATPC